MDPKNVVQRFWESYGQGRLDETWETYIAKDIIMHPPAGVELDRESWLAMEKAFLAAFEDVQVHVLEQVAEGDMVASRWRLTGRQVAEFMGVPSHGQTATVTGILLDRIHDDTIAEHWAELGLGHFLQSLTDARRLR